MMRTVGVIPARGGSKRLPGKNLALLSGRPLIAHTCAAAANSREFHALYVNTDCEAIAEAAVRAGAACPALRPAHLAEDDTPTRDAVVWMLEYLAQRNERYDALVILQPTSPLRTAADIRAAMRSFRQHAPCRVTSVSPIAPTAWHARMDSNGRLTRMIGDEPLMRINGAIYIHRVSDYTTNQQPVEIAYVMPAERGIDIDARHDLDLCEFLLTRASSARDATLVETLS
ncbi:MAG: acylneuraminate cytidylyltransferase family protein [Phycisphaerales bacterium]|nr:acylneuraminate cytidylyltransferase family protein [Phycisphaerales bacterium]